MPKAVQGLIELWSSTWQDLLIIRWKLWEKERNSGWPGFVRETGLFICVLFSHPVVSDSSQPHGLQHPRPPWPSPSPRVCPGSCPLRWWGHPAISSSDIFPCCSQSFPSSGSFPVSQLFTSGDQNIRASASASAFPIRIQLISFKIDWFDLCL